METKLLPCQWCGGPLQKLYHHGEYAWSDRFSVDGKTEIYLYVCGYCGKVMIIYAD